MEIIGCITLQLAVILFESILEVFKVSLYIKYDLWAIIWIITNTTCNIGWTIGLTVVK